MRRDLEEIRLYNNSFEGAISSRIVLLRKLQHLDLARNHLNSGILLSWGLLTSHNKLHLSFNYFTGNILLICSISLIRVLADLFPHSWQIWERSNLMICIQIN